MEKQGWIKLHRKILDWEWIEDTKTFSVFAVLLLMANHQDKKWKGILIKKGQLITSYAHIAAKFNDVSVQTVRTIINRLKSTGELTSKPTNKYSLITIVRYDFYQSDSLELTGKSTSKLTNNQQTTNKQLTTNKNVKNDKNEKKEDINILQEETPPVKNRSNPQITEIINYLKEKTGLVTLDGTIKQNRFRAKNLLDKLKKTYPDRDSLEIVKQLIDIAYNDQYFASNLTSVSWLYYNMNKIIQRFKMQKEQNRTVVI